MNSYTHFNKLGALALLVGALSFSSCKKDDNNVCGGTPAITQVSSATDRTASIAKGNLADWVILQGNNFCNVQKIVFNDVEASLEDAYITPTEITVRVPRVIPKEVNNRISLVTAAGAVETAYTLSIPPLVIAGMSNEYTPAGQRMAVVGQNLDLYGITPETGKVLWAGTVLPILKTTADSAYFMVPTSAAKGATVKVVDANNVTRDVPGQYRDDRNIIFSYDMGGSVWGADTYITTAATPGPVNGKYLRVNKTIGAWEWTEFSANNLAIPNDVIVNPGNYALKFEVNTLKPFGTNVIKFLIDGNAGSVNTYQWKPIVPFNTRGKWSTMSIKLSDIINTPLLPSKAQHEFKFLFHGDGALDADISFDNFRIVPKD
ncbi:glycan-binding surface protein [Hymenobacter volaticus]|uniref:Glycan-binding surface protein n=1 Tax=Hymenobacter volaticus TaxID=2932254 RepID=A0ABY4GDY6_9BACT|nr:glycan-binding surface protein [Hymenobacter volaticus]UOQ69120.1 glycan-binding surface protein [Hymenobacter volaticus]